MDRFKIFSITILGLVICFLFASDSRAIAADSAPVAGTTQTWITIHTSGKYRIVCRKSDCKSSKTKDSSYTFSRKKQGNSARGCGHSLDVPANQTPAETYAEFVKACNPDISDCSKLTAAAKDFNKNKCAKPVSG